MSDFILEKFKISKRLLGQVLWQIRKYSAETQQASALFDLIVTQLKSCNSQNCEPETIYKNAMAIGDFWGLGAEDFKRRVAESKLEEESDNWFFRAFVGGAKFARNAKDTRTAEEKYADLEKLKQLAGIKIESLDPVSDKGEFSTRSMSVFGVTSRGNESSSKNTGSKRPNGLVKTFEVRREGSENRDPLKAKQSKQG